MAGRTEQGSALRLVKTARLLLRAPRPEDAADIERLAGEREIALNTLHIPHPYPAGAAAGWIASHGEKLARGIHTFAIEHEGAFAGVIGMEIERDHDRAEIGYWIGVPYWSRGFATEAAVAMIRYGFEEQNLNRIFAFAFSRNPASSRVLEKAGMRHEGTLHHHIKKWGEYIDVEMWGIVR
jgi:RimJ/RimL family protein N-acetyltransferase